MKQELKYNPLYCFVERLYIFDLIKLKQVARKSDRRTLLPDKITRDYDFMQRPVSQEY